MGWSYTSNGGIVFDLDDPRFTSPMSVISGLASGYCERKAAVSAAYAAASWTTDAVKSKTVSRLAANIAINHDIGTVSAYGAGSETFREPQSWTVGNPAQTKTFMDYFDHDLESLANSYVTRGGAAYNDFNSLAVAASARAASDVTESNYTGYTVGTTATSGGVGGVAGTSEYTGAFVPIFAAGWAVERRDMLEELRYVKGTGVIDGMLWDGKIPQLGITWPVMGFGENAFVRYPEIDKNVLGDAQIWHGWTSGTGQATVRVYTSPVEPDPGDEIYASDLYNYERYPGADDDSNNIYAWSNTNLTPSVVYTATPYMYQADVSSSNAGQYNSCGKMVSINDRVMTRTGEEEKTNFERYPAGDANGRYCWASGGMMVWTNYPETNTDPGDKIFDAPDGEQISQIATYSYAEPWLISFMLQITIPGYERYPAADDAGNDWYCWSSGAELVWVGYDRNLYIGANVYDGIGGSQIGEVEDLQAGGVTVFMRIGNVSYAYTYDALYEADTLRIATADGVFLRNPDADDQGKYAWTNNNGTEYTNTELAYAGSNTVAGHLITGATANVVGIPSALVKACDTAHAAVVTDYPVDVDTGIIDCAISGFNDHAMSIKSITPNAWLTAAAEGAATGTAKLPTTGITVSNFTSDSYVYDIITCPAYCLVSYKVFESPSDPNLPYEARIAARYTIRGGSVVNALSMTGIGIGGKTVQVSMFLGTPRTDHYGYFFSSYIKEESIRVTGTTTYNAADVATMNAEGGTLIVCAGGTATLNGCAVTTAIVEPTGSLVLAGDDVYVKYCCALTGIQERTAVSGTVVNPYKSTNGCDKIGSYFVDFNLVYTSRNQNVIVDQDTQYTNADRPENGYVVVTNGAVCSMTGMDWAQCYVRVDNGATCVMRNGARVGEMILMPGGSAIISSSDVSAGMIIHSGASCAASGVWNAQAGSAIYTGMRDLDVRSGGKLTLNEYTGYGADRMDGVIWQTYFDTGAIVQLYNAAGTLLTHPVDLYAYKLVTYSPPRSFVYTFFNHKLSAGNVQLHEGWNVFTVTIPAGATTVDLATGTANFADVPPVREILFTGVRSDEFYKDYGPGTTQIVGFSLCTIKVDGLDIADCYPQFTYRKFGNDHK